MSHLVFALCIVCGTGAVTYLFSLCHYLSYHFFALLLSMMSLLALVYFHATRYLCSFLLPMVFAICSVYGVCIYFPYLCCLSLYCYAICTVYDASCS